MSTPKCNRCEALEQALAAERARNTVLAARITELEAESTRLSARLAEAMKLIELQQADLDRYKKAYAEPNHPERVPREQLQLAFERVLASLGPTEPANDAASASGSDAGVAAAGTGASGGKKRKRRSSHGRRKLDFTNMPVEEVQIDPPEVLAAKGEGFVHIGDEISERVARRQACYLRLRVVRRKFARVEQDDNQPTDSPVITSDDNEKAAVLVAPLPESLWPKVMADPSAIADIIIKKYADYLPLNRQETISARDGFVVPRSTQAGWLKAAYPVCAPVVEAMFLEAKQRAFCIATDATGAKVRAKKKCESWHVFVLVADRDHVVFRHTPEHTSDAVSTMLAGFSGFLLADASSVYDALFRTGDVTEVACWMHQRRYVYRALESDRERALEGLSIIGKLFEIERDCRALGLLPDAFGAERAARARPMLELLERWVEKHRDEVDPRGPLDKAIGYYENQREALWRFLDDGRLPLDNGVSERALRNVVLGEHNWTFFANETGLRWYTTFRSLIASCVLHRINPELYMEELLRLAPHWPKNRALELAPKYWPKTRERLDARQRAIITRPWEAAPALATDIFLPAAHHPASADPAPVTSGSAA